MFDRQDSTAKNMAISSMAWLLFAITLGLTQALEFVAPDFLAGTSWLVFSRIRQAHVNSVAFGFLSMAMIAGWYYIVPRLTKTNIFSQRLGNLTMVLWNVVLAWGVVALVLGHTQAREYAELIWPVDIGIMVLLLLTGFNIFMTISRRTVDHLYVSLWYIMGSLIWFPIVFAIGNVIWMPPTGALMGLNDAVWNWFYGHNILGLWFTTGTVPLIYYIVPKEIKQPLYGYTLALIAFWFLAFFYSAVGTHHILQSPVPEWLKTIAVITSVGMQIPVLAFIINIFMTMRGSWRVVFYSIPLRFALTGASMYMLVSLQGSFQALRGFNAFIHFTNWSVAHAHLALLGFVGFSVMGLIYYILPRICSCPLYSERLASVHWWMTAVGFLAFFSVLTAAGLTQAGAYAQGIPTVQVLPAIRPMFIGRAASGLMIVAAQFIFFYNMLRTLMHQQSKPEVAAKAANARAVDAASAEA